MGAGGQVDLRGLLRGAQVDQRAAGAYLKWVAAAGSFQLKLIAVTSVTCVWEAFLGNKMYITLVTGPRTAGVAEW